MPETPWQTLVEPVIVPGVEDSGLLTAMVRDAGVVLLPQPLVPAAVMVPLLVLKRTVMPFVPAPLVMLDPDGKVQV